MAGRPIPNSLKKQMQKATVKHTDMPNDMKTEVVDIIAGSIDKFTLPTGVNFEGATRAIKDALDKSYGFNWHCAMGKGFCFDVTAQNGTLMHCYYQGELAILVYKSGKLRTSLSGSGKVAPVEKSDLTSPVLRRRPGDAVALAMPQPEVSSSLQATAERRLTDSTPEKTLPATIPAQPDRSGRSQAQASLTRRSEGEARPAPAPKTSVARAKKAPPRPKTEGVTRAFAKSSGSSSKPLAGSPRTSQQGSRSVASHSKAEVRDLTPRSDVPSWPRTPGAFPGLASGSCDLHCSLAMAEPPGLRGRLWKIVGGAEKAGAALSSPAMAQRLPTGAVVEEIALQESRLQFRLVSGSGPPQGWISTEISSRALAVRLPRDGDGDGGGGTERGGRLREQEQEERGARLLEKGTKHVSSCLCDTDNLEFFQVLKEELSQGQRLFSGNWKPGNDGKWKTPWRNGLGSEQVVDSNGRKLPGLAKTLHKLCELFHADMLQWWANYYEDGSVGCEFHHDGHADFNITAGASFGAARYLTFQHEHSQLERSYLQENGDVFAFDAQVDQDFMHGVYPVDADVGARISIIIMGRVRSQGLQGLHSNFAEDQASNRLEFAKTCRQRLLQYQQQIATQEANLKAKEAAMEAVGGAGEDLLDAAYEVSSEHVVLSSRVVDLLDQLQQVSSSMRPWDQSQLARLQSDALLAMKQQQSTLRALKEIFNKEVKLLKQAKVHAAR
ncbi:Dnal4 [Symbiodinium sp. CCMP2592]|nr:Dnal4 [Symbiodinium sp. CCMP2592]